jgi:hypothetical protein
MPLLDNVMDWCQGTQLLQGGCCEVSWCYKLFRNMDDIGREQAGYRRHRFRVVSALHERLPVFTIDL